MICLAILMILLGISKIFFGFYINDKSIPNIPDELYKEGLQYLLVIDGSISVVGGVYILITW